MKSTTTTCGREPLVDSVVRFLARERVADAAVIRNCVERAIDESGSGAIDSLSARLMISSFDSVVMSVAPLDTSDRCDVPFPTIAALSNTH